MSKVEQYAHVLLFSCPVCEKPLTAACVSTRSNLEIAQGEWFHPHCACGWAGDLAGVAAVKHWVEPWHASGTIVPGEGGVCDGGSINRGGQ